ncbi:MAG: DUF302 domain-containing protein [Spirochaetia bacterium]|nr:DUF302 domain-containing protein [Spirochaetia bacterium]
MEYNHSKETSLSFEEAIEKVKVELKKEGFGVLTEIDVKDTLKQKLNVDFKKYRILGACNPPFAYKALQAEEKIGVMLPCNVIVHEKENGKIEVACINPLYSMQIVNNKALEEIGKEVSSKLQKVVNSF